MYNISWTEFRGQPVLKILRAGEDGKKRIDYMDFPFKPYYFIAKQMVDMTVENILKSIDPFANIVDTDAMFKDIKLMKVEMSSPNYVRDARDKLLSVGVMTYEADIPYGRRAMIDMGWSVEQPKHCLYFDIEVDASFGFPNPDEAATRILSIACIDETERIWVFSDDNEMVLIKKFLELTSGYEVVSGYNSMGFDWPYIQNRCKRLGLTFEWFSVVHVDLLPIYKLMSIRNRPSDYKLATVAEEELSERKIKPDWAVHEYLEVWKTRRSDLEAYNIQDAKLVKRLNDKYNIIGIIFSIAQLSHTTVPSLINAQKLGHGLNNSTAVDGVILSIAQKRSPRVVFPSKMQMWDSSESYPGAVVFDPVPGMHKNVAALDFSSLYPSIIKTFNIGLDTYCKEGDAEIKGAIGSFKKEPKSILSEAIEFMGKKRKEYKDTRNMADPASKEWQILYAQEYAVKQLLLSFYGVIGYQGSRYFDIDVASNVTMLGQAFVKKAKGLAELKGHEVVAGDTDSIYLKFTTHEGDIVDDAKKLADYINSNLKIWAKETYNVDNFQIEMDVERIFSSLWLQDVKKRYAGIVIWQSGQPTCYMYVVGMELKRRDWPKAVGEFQSDLLKMVLTGNPKLEVMKYIRDTKYKLYMKQLDDKLVVNKGLNKKIEEFKALAPHVKAAKKMVEMGHNVRVGDKIAYIRVGTETKDVLPVIDDKIPPISQKGYQFIWKNQFEPIMNRLGITQTEVRLIDSGEWTK